MSLKEHATTHKDMNGRPLQQESYTTQGGPESGGPVTARRPEFPEKNPPKTQKPTPPKTPKSK